VPVNRVMADPTAKAGHEYLGTKEVSQGMPRSPCVLRANAQGDSLGYSDQSGQSFELLVGDIFLKSNQ